MITEISEIFAYETTTEMLCVNIENDFWEYIFWECQLSLVKGKGLSCLIHYYIKLKPLMKLYIYITLILGRAFI